MDVREGTVPFPLGGDDAVTWYRVTGDLRPGDPDAPTPLVVLHGGPGATHDYLLSLVDLADDRAVVHYDQLGGGRSTHYPDRGTEFWTPELFVCELKNLVDALGIAGRHHVLGQSWGGFLAEEYAFTQPPGLRALVLADTAASWADFAAEAGKLREQLPAEVQATLAKHEEVGTYDDPEYMEACLVFYGRHVCRIPWPPEVAKTFELLEQDPTVYRTMNGPSEFHIIGSCKDWQVKDRLHEIRVPTLLVSGRYDEATPALQQVLLGGIADSEWVCFEESSHMPHVEERERYMRVVGDWLAQHD
ncbi:MAG TPA: proline iminopeptidase-family hydrolase [Gaiellaceae bacterium]|nr:proline iminopeptidase-family hydrolase [Gaiellaceae bacterium]